MARNRLGRRRHFHPEFGRIVVIRKLVRNGDPGSVTLDVRHAVFRAAVEAAGAAIQVQTLSGGLILCLNSNCALRVALLVALRSGVGSRGWGCAGASPRGLPHYQQTTLRSGRSASHRPSARGHRYPRRSGTGAVLRAILPETDAVQADPRKGGRVRAARACGGSELISAGNSDNMLVFDGLNL